jgi:hypothetical protein
LKGLWVSGDRIVALGEATGALTETFFGVETAGRTFTFRFGDHTPAVVR